MIAGIKTPDTSIIGAIVISGIVTALHNRYFDKTAAGVPRYFFQGSSFVVIVAFLAMIPCARLTLLGWPKVQMGIESLQAFLRSAGALGVWVYIFLERIFDPDRPASLCLWAIYLWSGGSGRRHPCLLGAASAGI